MSTSIAVMPAKLRQEIKAGLMMKREFALTAAESLEQINTAQKSSVPKTATINFVGVKAIIPMGRQPVYNMEVDEYHNFSVNGGIVVHNCMDDIRYFSTTIMEREVRANGV